MTIIAFTLPFDFEQPKWLWLALLVVPVVIVSLRSLRSIEPTRRVLTLLVRSLLLILVACCLAGIEFVRTNDDLTVIFLMDRSQSVEELESLQEEFVRQTSEDIPSGDRLGLIDFARNAYVQQLPMTGGFFVQPGRLPAMPNYDRTDIATAMRLAMAMFPYDEQKRAVTAKRIVLMSDGNENLGDVISEARRAQADGIPVDVLPLTYQRRNEVYVDRVIAPTFVERGEQAPIRGIIRTDQRVSGTLDIYHNGELVDIPEEQSRITLLPGTNALSVKLPIRNDDDQTYRWVFRPDDLGMDTSPSNNSAESFSFVSGPSRVLLISYKPEFDQALYEALLSEGVDVRLKAAEDLGAFDLRQMSAYASIMLANVPAAIFTHERQVMLASYVKDLGGGLIMLGGDESYGAGGWIGTPVEEVLPVSCEIKHKRVLPRGALALIMHSCEIPRGNYYGKEVAKKAVDTISSQDYIGVLAFTFSRSGNNWEVPLDLATNKAAVKQRIDNMQIGDMPDFASTMQMAYDELTTGRGRDAAQKHVIILSDGDAQPPPPQLLTRYVEAQITVSTVAIGWGAHVQPATMQRISQQTKGRYYDAKNPNALPQIFIKESKIVRRPLIVNEPFQPQVVFPQNELLTGVDVSSEPLPPLGGMVLTSPKQSPHVQVPVIRTTDDGDDPVLAHWQIELGKAVAFTSGNWPIWGKNWTNWPKFAKFWAQIVRWTMRQDAPAEFDTYTRVEGNRGRVVIDALDKDAGYLNFLELESNVIGPDGKSFPVRFTQTGPGHYETEFDADQAGVYLAGVHVRGQGKDMGMIRTGLSVPFSPELRDLSANEGLLEQVAQTTGGRVLNTEPTQANVFGDRPLPAASKQPGWEWMLAWFVLPAFLLDVAVRRLASWLALSIVVEILVLVVLLFGLHLATGPWWGMLGAFLLAELIGWTIRFRYISPLFDFLTHTVTALGQTGQRSAVALDKLKTTRDRVRDELEHKKEDSETTLEIEGIKRVAQPRDTDAAKDSTASKNTAESKTAKRRFDVGDEQAAQSAGDLHDQLGAPKRDDSAALVEKRDDSTKPGPGKASDEGAKESATQRLLRAKHRARKDKDDKDKK